VGWRLELSCAADDRRGRAVDGNGAFIQDVEAGLQARLTVERGRGFSDPPERTSGVVSPADHVSVCLRRRRFVEGFAPMYKHAGSG